MTLFATLTRKKGNWILEADLRGLSLDDIVFEEVSVKKTPEMESREEQKWAELIEESRKDGIRLYNGPLICLRKMKMKDGKLHLGITKSSYKEHHASCANSGIRDSYTEQFFPYAFTVKNGVIRPEIPNFEKLFPSFAAATTLETADGRLVYVKRAMTVDAYKNRPSLNSGGRFNGQPHHMVDELTQDSSTILRHIKGMLRLEYDRLPKGIIETPRLTGISRSLDDLDVTLCSHARINMNAAELVGKLQTGQKYAGMGIVPANAHGIATLLKMPFPATVYPAIVQIAQNYGVDPIEVSKKIERLD